MFGKVLKWFGIFIVVSLAANFIRVGVFNATHDSDDYASMAVDKINNSKLELGESFDEYIAVKDPNGAGILITYTFKEGHGFQKEMTEAEFRKMYINAVGRWKLKPFMENNVYIILKFVSNTKELVKKIIISPSNFNDY